jgi:Fic family protein
MPINIDSKYKNFNLKPDMELSCFLAKKDKVSYVYNVVSLEGNPMTFPEVKTLLEGITVGGHKIEDEQQVLNQGNALKELLSLVKEKKFDLNKDIFSKLNYLVANGEALIPGEFRTGRVTIGGTGHMPPEPDKLPQVFEEGLKDIKAIENPVTRALVFFGFGSINQFFWDGNKRTSRLMANGVLMENGYPVLNIKAKDKLEFNKEMIKFYDPGDYNTLLSWLAPYYRQEALKIGFTEQAPAKKDAFADDLGNRLNKGKGGLKR